MSFKSFLDLVLHCCCSYGIRTVTVREGLKHRTSASIIKPTNGSPSSDSVSVSRQGESRSPLFVRFCESCIARATCRIIHKRFSSTRVPHGSRARTQSYTRALAARARPRRSSRVQTGAYRISRYTGGGWAVLIPHVRHCPL